VFLTFALDEGEGSALRLGRFTPGKRARYPFDRKLGAPQSWSGRGGEEKRFLSSPGTEPRSPSP